LAPIEEAMSGLPVTSVVAAIEVPGAIQARFHRGIIDASERDRLLTIASMILNSVGQIGLGAAVRREATIIAAGHLLRTLDAIHLGAAVVVDRHQRRQGKELRFCTGDQRQGAAASSRFGAGRLTILPSL
jgi:hypothetical protein